MAQALPDIIASLDPVYNPQKQLVQQEQAALPAQQQAEQAGLDQAKTNAFGDINVQANDRGLSYSGMPIAEQSKYTGSTYLPAVANLKNTYANKGFALQQALLGINQTQGSEAQSILQGQQKAEADAADKAATLQLEREKMNNAVGVAQTRASSTKNPTASDQQASLNGLLGTAFQGYDPKNKAQNFYTEKAVIPYLVQKTGLPVDKIAKQVYAYRKATFGE